MQQMLSNQEVARIQHAETLREASRRHDLLRSELRATTAKPRRNRLLRRFRPVFSA